MAASYLDILPVEILYRIFDNLDIQTIFLSIRYVCKQLYLTTNSYDRYNFNFKFISKPQFYFICQYIPYENVTSLTLSDEDKTHGQIELFLSLCHIENFIRLQSLTLIQVQDDHLNIFLNYIIHSSLKYLSITTQTLHNQQNVIPSHLSTAIAHHSLRNLYLSIWPKDWNNLQWPINHTLRYIHIIDSITMKQFCMILQQSLNLRSLVLKELDNDNKDDNIYCTTFKQLTSLIFEDGRIDLNKLEQCLSLTPCLNYLKIIGRGNLFTSSFDGLQLERLIQTKLHLLKTFEFYFYISTYSNYRSRNAELLINSYRTSFWLNQMHCSINCDYIINSRKVLLYTLPICNKHFVYHLDSKKISLSNYVNRINENDMDYVKHLEIHLTKYMNLIPTEKNPYLFRNATKLTLGNDGEWPKNFLQCFSTLVDLRHIIKLSLSVNFLPEDMSNTVSNLKLLFNQASNLRSLVLLDYWTPENFKIRMKTICSLITSNIRHLQIRIKSLDDIKYILERVEYLTSITFEYAQILTINHQEFLQSLRFFKRYISSWDNQQLLHVWIGNVKKNL